MLYVSYENVKAWCVCWFERWSTFCDFKDNLMDPWRTAISQFHLYMFELVLEVWGQLLLIFVDVIQWWWKPNSHCKYECWVVTSQLKVLCSHSFPLYNQRKVTSKWTSIHAWCHLYSNIILKGLYCLGMLLGDTILHDIHLF